MIKIILDAHALSCPEAHEIEPGDHFGTVFESYIDRLTSLSELQRAQWAKVWISADATIALLESHKYPLWDALGNTLQGCGLDGKYQARDVIKIVDALLLKCRVLEDDTGIAEILVSEIAADERLKLEKRPQRLRQHLFRATALSEINRAVNMGNQVAMLMITGGIKQAIPGIVVSGNVEYIEMQDDDRAPLLLNLPHRYDFNSSACANYDHLDSLLDACQVWINAEGESGYEKALQIFICHRQNICREDYHRLGYSMWRFGHRFISTAAQLGFLHDSPKTSAVLNSLADIICRVNLRQLHPLREGQGPEEPQVKRGKDAAWRKDIGHEFHLHFWRTETGPEFASVVVHNDFSIPI